MGRIIYNALHILSGNGWEWLCYENQKIGSCDELYQFKIKILGNVYSSTVVAIVSANKKHLEIDGHYGVQWLEAIYENELPYTIDALEDIKTAIILAEENLLNIGMPFTKGYEFHGKNRANKARRNEKLRKRYNLDEMERNEE